MIPVFGRSEVVIIYPDKCLVLPISRNGHLGLSENRLNPYTQWLMIIIPMKNGYFIGNINPTFSDKPISFLGEFPPASGASLISRPLAQGSSDAPRASLKADLTQSGCAQKLHGNLNRDHMG